MCMWETETTEDLVHVCFYHSLHLSLSLPLRLSVSVICPSSTFISDCVAALPLCVFLSFHILLFLSHFPSFNVSLLSLATHSNAKVVMFML